MYFAIKLLRKFFKIFTASVAPWQVALGAALGIAVGFLPVFPSAQGPALLGIALIVLALLIDCHLSAFFLFLLIGKLLALALSGPAVAIGNAFDGLAQASATIPFLHGSLWSHTGWLGLSLIGLAAAPVVFLAMFLFTRWFHVKVRDKLLARRRLVSAGSIGSNPMLLRIVMWFFDI